MPIYKTRGHFCNYWRKVLENKCIRYKAAEANPLIWYAWKEPSFRDDITRKLQALEATDDSKAFNAALHEIYLDYHHLPRFGTK